MEAVADAADQLLELVGLGGIHACGGLVQQKQARLGGQRPGDLQLALLAVGQGARQFVLQVGQAHVLQQLVGALVHGLHLPAIARGAQRCGHPVALEPHVLGQVHVLGHRQRRKQADVLKGAGDALLRDAVGLQPRDVLCVQRDHAAGGLVDPRDHVEGGGLTRAVGADQGHDLPVADTHAQVVDRNQAAELHRRLIDLQYRAHHPFTSP